MSFYTRIFQSDFWPFILAIGSIAGFFFYFGTGYHKITSIEIYAALLTCLFCSTIVSIIEMRHKHVRQYWKEYIGSIMVNMALMNIFIQWYALFEYGVFVAAGLFIVGLVTQLHGSL